MAINDRLMKDHIVTRKFVQFFKSEVVPGVYSKLKSPQSWTVIA